MDIIEAPAVVTKAARPYLGIRVVTPFKGMFAVRDELMKELYAYGDGILLFRLHVVDMAGPMDIEVGLLPDHPAGPGPVAAGPAEDRGRVRAGVRPAGRYATMTYVNHGRRAHGMLIDWIRAADLEPDVTETPAGDRFGCRYEAYLTDPRTERMKTRWQIELAIRLAD
ncbi:hypothetical protein GCM10010172_78130 [Paractinoplanes ferrugineus]|uniref:Uncharacterized protein n=1 Tax=Paractinoplanes ferrugineus TaxID=113564 RepID=A0A919MAS3_9ACTN|nr:hypothetical protein [Actinoplanes ferrugineus]GIE12886.1 hypothetical protein Afe05nite_47260 [Actinoplanes ferrugineus]